MNNVNLIGRTADEIKLRYTQNEKAVARFTLAVKRLTNENEADFIQCQIWGAKAEAMKRCVRKGNRVAITGSIRTGSYEKDGVKHYTTEVLVENVEFLEPKRQQNQQPNNDEYYGTEFQATDDDIPY